MNLRGILLLALFCALMPIFAPNARAESCGEKACPSFLVKFPKKKSDEEIQSLLEKYSLEILRYYPAGRIYLVEETSGIASEEILKKLNAEKDIVYAEPNYEIQANLIPNDPRYPDLWALNNVGQYSGSVIGTDIGMEFVWGIASQSEPVVVAVLDSGIDYAHEDLAANMWKNSGEIPNNGRDDDANGYADDYYGYNFVANNGDPQDDYFHGTHVAGIIGAVGDNGIGVTGVNWNVRLMALKFLKSNGVGSLSDAIEAINYAIDNGAKVINNSWDFYYAGSSGLPVNPAQEPVQSLRDAIAAADEAGIIFVAAAGNDGLNNDSYPVYPSSYSVPNVVSVAATDIDDSMPAFSNYGRVSVDLGAPGVLIESTYPSWKENPPYHFLSGTSMATPFVAGAAALLWSEFPELSHRQIIESLYEGVMPLSDLSGKSVTGGRLDLAESFALQMETINRAPIANAGTAQYKTVGETILLKATATDADGDSPLTYRWTLTSPINETTAMTGSQISFLANLAGTYTATVFASDGESESFGSTVKIYVSLLGSINNAPVANAGPNQLRKIGEKVLLQGKAFDADSNPLTYSWKLTAPSSSKAALSATDSASTSFTPDVIGTYSATLTASDGKTAHSSTAKIYVNKSNENTVNVLPVVSAGPNQLRRVGDTVTFSGRASDQNGDALTYSWTLTLPAQSRAALRLANTASPSFLADVTGTYTATLIVSDGKSSASSSAKAYVTQAISNTALTKYNDEISGGEQEFPTQSAFITARKDGNLASLDPALGDKVQIGEKILLDASDSNIANGLKPDYEWALVEKPLGSEIDLENREQTEAAFVPDLPGRYTVKLSVTSGKISLYAERAFLVVTPQADNANDNKALSTPTGGCSLVTN